MKNNYEVRGDITAIFLIRKGKIIETIINTEDLSKVQEYKYTWHANWSEHTKSYYVRGYTPKKNISLHRFILNDPLGLVVDHINHDTLNNRRCNLRAVSQTVNGQNRKGASKNSSSKTRGVHWNSAKKMWQTRITKNKKRIFLGYYSDKEIAKKVVERELAKMA